MSLVLETMSLNQPPKLKPYESLKVALESGYKLSYLVCHIKF